MNFFLWTPESCVVKNDLPACENATGRCKPEELTAADAVDSELSCKQGLWTRTSWTTQW